MRPNLHLLHDRRGRRGPGGRRTSPAPPRARRSEPPGRGLEPDQALRRAREAGGPEDQAHYSCSCGFLFEAEVSTTVACPHCGSEQAW